MGSVIRRSEGGNSFVDRKPDAFQRESSNLISTLIDHNFRYLSSMLGASLSGTNNRSSMDIKGTQKSYKYTRAETTQIDYFNIYPYASISKMNSFTNEQHFGFVIYIQSGGNQQQNLNKDISKEICDYLLLKKITITVEFSIKT